MFPTKYKREVEASDAYVPFSIFQNSQQEFCWSFISIKSVVRPLPAAAGLSIKLYETHVEGERTDDTRDKPFGFLTERQPQVEHFLLCFG